MYILSTTFMKTERGQVYVKGYNGLMSKRTLGVLALLAAALIWGIGPVVTKVGLEEVPVFSLGFLRNVLGMAILLPFAYKGFKKIKRKDILRLTLIGLFGSGLNAIFFFAGLSRTSATASAAIFATVPLVNALAASYILREKPTLVRMLGVIVGFLGSLLIALGPALLGGSRIDGDVLGNLLVVGSVFFWVAYIIGSKKLLEDYPPLTLVTFSMLIGTIALLPLFVLELLNNPLWYLNAGGGAGLAILYGGVMSGVLAFTLFQWGMQYTSAFEAGIVVYLQPPVTDFFAVAFLGENLSPLFIIGTVLILGGVFLATSYEFIKKRREG